jgi:hypothetical protein
MVLKNDSEFSKALNAGRDLRQFGIVDFCRGRLLEAFNFSAQAEKQKNFS